MKIQSTEAAVLFESHKPLRLVEIGLPSELLPGQVLVELITSGICGAQINEIDAVKGSDRFLPHLLGHEGIAKVLETGPSVVKVKSGDTVILHWRPSAGITSLPPKYTFEGKQVNAGWVTTFNRNAIVSENRVTKIDAGSIDPVIAPLLGCAFTTALGVLENDAHITHRDSLLIIGFGGVGIALIKFARIMSPQKIVVVDKDPGKEALALKMGADSFVLHSSKENSLELLKTIFGENRPSIAIDTSGHAPAIELCYEITSDTGRVILVGVPRVGDNVSLYTLPLHFGKSISGSKGGGAIPDRDIPFILDLVSKNLITLNDYPTSVIPFPQINEGIERLRNGTLGRVVVDFSI
jgi:hypothetical protein